MTETPLVRVLRREMERTGLSMNELSKKAGKNPSVVHSIISGQTLHPRTDTLEGLARGLGRRWSELAAMVSQEERQQQDDEQLAVMNDETSDQPPSGKASDQPGAGMRRLVEYDVQLSAGFGSVAAEEAAVGEWAVPRTWLPRLHGRSEECVVVEVVGDSMVPEFHAGDRVLIDTANRRPTPPGYFALWDGLGTVIKQVEHIPHSDPPTLVIRSRNPEYQTYEREAAEVQIAGRVIGLMRRL